VLGTPLEEGAGPAEHLLAVLALAPRRHGGGAARPLACGTEKQAQAAGGRACWAGGCHGDARQGSLAGAAGGGTAPVREAGPAAALAPHASAAG
jgi:hypothetical protein